jgi:Tol biopolymer transport system component
LPQLRDTGAFFPVRAPAAIYRIREEQSMKTSAWSRVCAILITAGLAAGGGVALAAEGDRIVLTEVDWTGRPEGGIAVIDDTDHPTVRTLTVPPQHDIDRGPSWSPTGKQLAFLRFSMLGSAIYRINVDGSGLERLVGGDEIDLFGEPVWGPRSTNLIAFVDGNESCIYVISPDGSNQREVLCPRSPDGAPRGVQGMQWFPDGKHLLVCMPGGSVPADVHQVEVATGSTRLLASFEQCPVQISISPDGSQLALENDDAVHLLDVATGTSRFLTDGTRPVFSADGSKVAFQKEVNNFFHPLFIIDTDGGNARQITPPEPDGRYSAYRPIEWSVDGSEIVVQAAIDIYGEDFFSHPSGIIRLDDGSFRVYLSNNRVHGLGFPNPWFEREDAAIALTNCVPRRNLIGRQGGGPLYRLDVPAGGSKLLISTSGGTGDVSLYASLGEAPSPDDAQYWSTRAGTNREAISIGPVPAGTFYIKVIGELDYGGVNLRACYAP